MQFVIDSNKNRVAFTLMSEGTFEEIDLGRIPVGKLFRAQVSSGNGNTVYRLEFLQEKEEEKKEITNPLDRFQFVDEKHV